jgi:hypothetical protein
VSKYSDPTLKYLFGTASQCARPECSQPLIARERGKPTVLVQIARIRSEKENGPRYDPNYPKSEINAFPNLLLLCPPHHKPVDDNESDYTVDELEQWKEAQIAQQGQTLSAPDVSEIAEQISESSIASVGAIGVTNLARAVRILIENARRTRELPWAAVRDWNSTYEDARSRHVIWDADGNRIYAEPSRRETLEHKARVVAALQEAVAALSPLADAVHGELQAINAVIPNSTTGVRGSTTLRGPCSTRHHDGRIHRLFKTMRCGLERSRY